MYGTAANIPPSPPSLSYDLYGDYLVKASRTRTSPQVGASLRRSRALVTAIFYLRRSPGPSPTSWTTSSRRFFRLSSNAPLFAKSSSPDVLERIDPDSRLGRRFWSGKRSPRSRWPVRRRSSRNGSSPSRSVSGLPLAASDVAFVVDTSSCRILVTMVTKPVTGSPNPGSGLTWRRLSEASRPRTSTPFARLKRPVPPAGLALLMTIGSGTPSSDRNRDQGDTTTWLLTARRAMDVRNVIGSLSCWLIHGVILTAMETVRISRPDKTGDINANLIAGSSPSPWSAIFFRPRADRPSYPGRLRPRPGRPSPRSDYSACLRSRATYSGSGCRASAVGHAAHQWVRVRGCRECR